MALYKGHIFKVTSADLQHPWRNVYWLNAGDPDAAMVKLQVIMAAEQDIHSTNISFTKLVVDDPTHAQNPRVYIPFGVGGLFAATGGPLPLWNVVRVDFEDLDHSRPERKYYRTGAGSGDLLGGQTWSNALIANMQSVMDTLIASGSTPTTPTGGTITAAVVQSLLQMRQVGWHRRSRPGFHRGYLPNV